jgi:hypothetical protein
MVGKKISLLFLLLDISQRKPLSCTSMFASLLIKKTIMCNEKKSLLRQAPLFFVTAILIISGVLKIGGIHPMLKHFTEMGFDPVFIKLLGMAEIVFSVLFLFTPTSKIGLLLLTAYFGGAMAAEIPFHQVLAPLIPLVFVWVVAFIRQPSTFLSSGFSKNSANLTTHNL